MTREATGDIDPMTGWSRCIAQLMAESIGIARRLEPKSWAVLDGNPGVHVNVGKRTICVLGRDHVELIVDMYWLTGFNAADHDVVLETGIDRTYSSLAMLTFAPESSVSVLGVVNNSHLSAVRKIGNMKTSQRNRHNESLRKELERVSGMTISQPGYSDYRR